MGRKRRTDNFFKSSIHITPEIQKSAELIMIRSAAWKDRLKSFSTVACFCVSFVSENIDAVESVMMAKESDVGA
jgi:hypothetical protein